MANYVYPAVFHPNEDDSSITVIVPDLPGCITEGKDLADALFMAEDAVSMWLWYAEDSHTPIPAATQPPRTETWMNAAGSTTPERSRRRCPFPAG